MTDLRYPIGKFQRPETIEPAKLQEAIEQIAELPPQLRQAVDGLSDAQLDTRYRSEGWTVRQVVHHTADSHLNAYVRFRIVLSEPGEPTIRDYDENAWAELTEAKGGPIEPSLVLLEGLHARWATMLRDMNPAAFARSYIHPAKNRPVNLATATLIYAWHGLHHTAHITTLAEREGW